MNQRLQVIVLTAFIMSGCKTIPVVPASYQKNVLLLDSVNQKAVSDSDWFKKQTRGAIKNREKYQGEVPPELAFYLERDTFVFEDKNLTAYIQEITERLLNAWQGPRPEITIVVESSEYFNAYADEFNQLHISTELLRSLKNEDQLAAVLAHELSHFLLRHNIERSSSQTVSGMLETAGFMSTAIGEYQTERKRDKKYEENAANTLLGFKSAGLLWTDLLSPKRSRRNESEADRMGLDLLIRANYNYEEFPVVIGKIHDAAVRRSERIKLFGELTDAAIDANKDKLYKKGGGKWHNKLGDVALSAVNNVKDAGLNTLAASGISHENREVRIDALKTYLNTVHGGGELPPESRNKKFLSVARGSLSKRQFDQDLTAMNALSLLNRKKLSEARSKSARLSLSGNQIPLSIVVAKSSVDMSRGNYSSAIQSLRSVRNQKNSPAEVYIKLADIYIKKKQYTLASETLALGINRIGRDYRFLPSLIKLNRKQKNISVAEKYTIKCKDYDGEKTEKFASTFLNFKSDKNSYYKKCTRVLGYDVLAKQERERTKKRSKQSAESKSLQKSLEGIFK